MRLISFIPTGTKIDFMKIRVLAVAVSTILCVISIGFVSIKGLNLGIDFKGGTAIEIRTNGPANIADLRSRLSGLGLGDLELQEFGLETDVLIRVEQQPGGEEAQLATIQVIKNALPADVEYRRTEFVGPKVGGELIEAGIEAVVAALVVMLIYIWFRFEWQFGLGAIIALIHDILLTIGIFSVFWLEFNLTTIAAILTIAGYSINDTVVVYDRVRENLRKYKKMDLRTLLNLSLNETLSRTILTSFTTLLALVALFFFGGEVIKGFTFAMIWGILVGTYSSIFVAVSLLLYMNIGRTGIMVGEEEEAAAS